MSKLMNLTNPELYIMEVSAEQVLGSVNHLVDAYKEYKMCDTIEATKRTALRENARVNIASIEAETKVRIHKIDTEHECKMELIQCCDKTLDNLNGEQKVQMCAMLLDKIFV